MFLFFVIIWSTSCLTNDRRGFSLVDNVTVSKNHEYNDSSHFLMDSIQFAFSGTNDSLTILLNDLSVFSGTTFYDHRIGRGIELFSIKRPVESSFKFEVKFNNKKISFKKNLVNDFNSLLILSHLNYFEEHDDLEESVILYPYVRRLF